MPIDPQDLRTGGALVSAVAASLVQQRESAAELAPGAQVGIYRVVRELGRGGMAIVYLAERADGEYEQQVALKWMQAAQTDLASEALFRRERQALADLRHAHIARLLDGGRSEEGRPWFAMEYIDGAPLDRHCVQAALPQHRRLHLFLQVCAAVAFAHAHGVIHGDIKPSNVLVDADGSVKLLDFGIARLLGQDDAPAAHAFTPGFASPEQARGEALTVGSDTYQLGRLLAALLSADNEELATLTCTSAALATTAHDLPLPLPRQLMPDMAAILRMATADDPEARYRSAEAFAADVRALLDTRPVAARRSTFGYRAQRFMRRHAVATSLVALATLALFVAAGVFAWRLAQERDRARLQAERAEAGEEFLVSLFRVSDPGVNRGEKLTARELLERGAQRIEADTRAAPAVRARLLQVLAEVNFNLGDYAATQHLLERALREPVEPSQRLSLQAMRLWTLNRRGETAAAVEQAPPIIDAVPGGNEFDALRGRALNAAARAAAQTGDARAAAWQAAALANALRAGDVEQQGVALRTQAFLEEVNGDYRASLASTTRAIELLTASLGATSPEVFSARTNRAYLLGELNENTQALVEIEALHRDVSGVIPPEHIAAIYVDASRATALRSNGRAAEALAIALDTAQRCIATLGESHMQCGHVMMAVSNPLRDLNRPAEAAQWLERLVRNRRNGMGADHIYTAYAEHWLARVYCQTGRRDEGLPLATRIAKRFEQELPADNYDRRESSATLALCNAAPASPVPTQG